MLPAAKLAAGAASIFANGLSNLGQQFLKKADTDTSNSVSLGEFASIMQGGQNMPSGSTDPAVSTEPTEATRAKFGKVDSNADGQLTSSEIHAYNQQLASQIQAQLVQIQQMYGASQPKASPGDKFTAMDSNADGAISKDELASFLADKDSARAKPAANDMMGKANALFDKINTNADDTLSASELSAFAATRKSKKPKAANGDTNLQDAFAQISKLLEAIQKQTSDTAKSKKGSAAAALAAATAYKKA